MTKSNHSRFEEDLAQEELQCLKYYYYILIFL